MASRAPDRSEPSDAAGPEGDRDEILRVDQLGRVRLLTLARPHALNAFDTPLYRALAAALDDAAGDHHTACVVVTGAGRAFSAGQDLAEMSAIDTASGAAAEHGFPTLMDALTTFAKPLVAAVNGVAVGIGLTMLLHCDLVVMARSARLRAPFTSLGVVPEAASSVLLPAIMGQQAAAWALYTSSWIDADAAVAHGLAWRAVDDDALLDETLALAAEIATMPTASLRGTKELVLAARADAVAAARAREDAAFARMVLGPANLEALTAFLDKREPDFTNLPPQ